MLWTETENGGIVFWAQRDDGDIYMESRSAVDGNIVVLIIPKDEAINLMAWLSEATK